VRKSFHVKKTFPYFKIRIHWHLLGFVHSWRCPQNAFRRADGEGQIGRKQWGNHWNRHNFNNLLCRIKTGIVVQKHLVRNKPTFCFIFTKKNLKNQEPRKQICWNNIPTPCHKPWSEKQNCIATPHFPSSDPHIAWEKREREEDVLSNIFLVTSSITFMMLQRCHCNTAMPPPNLKNSVEGRTKNQSSVFNDWQKFKTWVGNSKTTFFFFFLGLKS
jgi:hypothetical protein